MKNKTMKRVVLAGVILAGVIAYASGSRGVPEGTVGHGAACALRFGVLGDVHINQCLFAFGDHKGPLYPF